MKQLDAIPKKRLLTTALLLALAQSAAAQTAQQTDETDPPSEQNAPASEAGDLDTIEVRGIRGSLTSAMNVKRNGQGVVDGISAEEIGKFPDTNLAESLQRISGVSIDRSIGEGSRVTVRGVGPDFNMVLLNGRQMPASSIGETSASNSRAFDFANLASEAISGIEVFKTSRAGTPASPATVYNDVKGACDLPPLSLSPSLSTSSLSLSLSLSLSPLLQ